MDTKAICDKLDKVIKCLETDLVFQGSRKLYAVIQGIDEVSYKNWTIWAQNLTREEALTKARVLRESQKYKNAGPYRIKFKVVPQDLIE